MVVLPVINFLLDALTRVMRCPVSTSSPPQDAGHLTPSPNFN